MSAAATRALTTGEPPRRSTRTSRASALTAVPASDGGREDPSTNTSSAAGCSAATPVLALVNGNGSTLTVGNGNGASSAGRRSPRPVTIQEALEINRLYEQDKSYREIGELLGRSKHTIGRYVRRPRTKSEGQLARGWDVRVPPYEVARAADLYEAGLTLEETRAAMGLCSVSAVRTRLRHSRIGIRSKSQAFHIGKYPQRLPAEKIARILELHGVKSAYKVAAEVGVDDHTVTRTWLRHGLDVPRGRSASKVVYRRCRAGEGVATAPLWAAVGRICRDGWEDLAEMVGVDSALFRAWRRGERRVTHAETADRVMIALDRMWWEIFDPEAAPGCFSSVRSRDVVAWSEAMLRACELWGEG